MNMNNRCNSCGYNPCQCHTSCPTLTACIPPELSSRVQAPTVTVEGLLQLIDAKCDKEICQLLQVEISLLFVLLGVEHLRPNPTNPVTPTLPGTTPVVTPPTTSLPGTGLPTTAAFQLITNMVETLDGDLTDKYASAELLKSQIKALWACMKDKKQHHGEWADNHVVRAVQQVDDDYCLLDGDIDSAPKTVVIPIPVDAGSTVFNTIEGRHCLFESLVDDNTEEPTKLTVLEGKWLSYCDMKDAIDCVLPRRILTNCHEACDDTNGDGVVEDKTICERMEAVEAYMLAHP